MDFNINEYCFVQLTDEGRMRLMENHDKLNELAGGVLGSYRHPVEDDDGWSKWQMWDLMGRVGDMLGHGKPMPFSANIRLDIKEQNNG